MILYRYNVSCVFAQSNYKAQGSHKQQMMVLLKIGRNRQRQQRGHQDLGSEAKSELTSGLIHVFAKNDSLLSYAIGFDIERREAGAALQKKHRQKHASLSMNSQQYRL